MTWLPAVARAFGTFAGACWIASAVAVVALSTVPRLTGHELFIVRSGSMEPAIQTGSVVVVRPVLPATLRAGDVITFDRTDGLAVTVTHRIVAIEGNPSNPTFRTKGDANANEDPVPVSYTGMGGKVVASIPYLGYVQNALSQPLARALLIGPPAVILTWSYLRDLWRPRR